ncbi:hypothetical protein [Ulvibacter antarcticus]|uniref:SdrD B-like protein n=1 Tax=Ulvibacter antarcticus TaxID=442714 RepID=A0A3L9YKI0_9FLAO|nr:hypothetical protein [Ulvibacter antarcticus]RMA58635.1 hypothetical protein BXY75_2009 [Ulvibacter antarcticus]
MKTLRLLFVALLAFNFFITSCSKADDFGHDDGIQMGDDDPGDNSGNLEQNFGSTISRDFFGQVVDENGDGLQGATVKIGAQNVATDENGIFFIENASVKERFAYLKVSKQGYVSGGRAVHPTDGTNRVKIMLLTADVTATVSSGTPETVSLGNGTSVNLPGAYIDENGNPYNGTVKVILNYLDPAASSIFDVMPGMLFAEDENGDEAYLETYGMISVELRDLGGNELNIDPNNPAELKFPLDANLMGVAPSTIPLWSFNEDKGYWIEDGTAQLQGNMYVGEVTHFSFWNCDAPFPVVDFCTTVLDNNGNPLSNTVVLISTPTTPYSSTGITDQNGQVCGKVASGVVMTIEVKDLCGNPVFSTSMGPFAAATTYGPIIVPPGSSTSEQVIGNFNECTNVPVTNGYVILEYGGSTFFENVTSGTFNVNLISCPASNVFTVEAVDTSNLQSSGIVNYTFTSPVTNLGTITACNAVTEYIEYTIAGNPQKVFVSNINVEQYGTGFSVYSQVGGDFFYLGSSDATLGTYTHGYAGPMEMNLQEVLDIDTGLPVNITFQLNAYGPVGGYVDLTFSGTYTDYSTNTLETVSGSLHVIRDF